jgi:hypothetical protein
MIVLDNLDSLDTVFTISSLFLLREDVNMQKNDQTVQIVPID